MEAETRGGRVMNVRQTGVHWGLIDQGLYSGTNVLLNIFVARTVGAENFGAFSLTYILFILFIGSSRAFAGGSLLIRFGAEPTPTVRRHGARAIAAAWLIGLVLGVGCVVVGGLAGGIYTGPMTVLGISLPFLLAQDAVRSTFFAMEQPKRAAINDSVWAGLQVAGVAVVLIGVTDPTATPFVVTWSIAGSVAFCVGLYQLGLRVGDLRPAGWTAEIGDLGRPLLLEYLLATGPAHLLFLLTPAVAGTSQLGILRGAYVFFGPLNVLHEASQMIFIPSARRAGSLASIKKLSMNLAFALGAVAAVWAIAVGILPDGIGELAIGDIWDDTSVVVWILGFSLVAEAMVAGIGIGLRAIEKPKDLVKARAIAGPLVLAVGLIAGSAWGAPGLALGFAVGYALTALLARDALARTTDASLPAAMKPITSIPRIAPWPV